MKPRINFITLAADDLKASVEFYKDGLGFPTDGLKEGHNDHCLFELANDLQLVIYQKKGFLELTANTKTKEKSAGFILSHIVQSKAEVYQIMDSVRKNGGKQIGTITDEA